MISHDNAKKPRRSKKVKTNSEDNPNMIKIDETKDNIPTLQAAKLEENSIKKQQANHHNHHLAVQQPYTQSLVSQSVQPTNFANTKKYEDLAELAQKNNNDILREIMGQNGINGFQDLMKQMNHLDSNELFKLNLIQMNNQPQQQQLQQQQQFNNVFSSEGEILAQYAKLFQDCIPLSTNNLSTNNGAVDKSRNEILHNFYNSYSNK